MLAIAPLADWASQSFPLLNITEKLGYEQNSTIDSDFTNRLHEMTSES
jgi:hypothetical protein